MIFKKLPSNSKRLLDDLVNADNPTQYLSDRFDSANGKEDEELRSLLRELREEGYITIPMWAENKPYNVILNNSARTYNERLAEYEAEKQSQRKATYVFNDNSVKIGDGAKITKSTIASRIDKQPSETKKSFVEKHPIIVNIIVAVVGGFLLMFSVWDKIVTWIEGLL